MLPKVHCINSPFGRSVFRFYCNSTNSICSFDTMLLFSCFCMSIALVSALPQGNPSTTSSLNVDDPSSGDPTTPPKTLTAPSKPPNPWASGGIPTVPAACTDPSNPSDDCFNALATQAQNGVHAIGGYLSHDGTCTGTQEGQLETATWDASTLANYMTGWPANARGVAAGKFYMGPDFPTQQQRIKGKFCQYKVIYRRLHRLSAPLRMPLRKYWVTPSSR